MYEIPHPRRTISSAAPFARRLAVNFRRSAALFPHPRIFLLPPGAAAGDHVAFTAVYINGAVGTSAIAATATGNASTGPIGDAAITVSYTAVSTATFVLDAITMAVVIC